MAKKKSRAPGRHHAFYVAVMVTGWLLPPLAVLMRFGFGKDFGINLILTIAGYIPGHFHNFLIQNCRDNRKRGRTPKWALRYGLVKDHDKEKKAKSDWANRFDERTTTNRYDGDELAEDEWGNPIAADSRTNASASKPSKKRNGGGWVAEAERARSAKATHATVTDGPNGLSGPNARDLERVESDDDASLAPAEREEFYSSTGRRRSRSNSISAGSMHDPRNSRVQDLLPGEGDRQARNAKGRKRGFVRNLVTGSSGTKKGQSHADLDAGGPRFDTEEDDSTNHRDASNYGLGQGIDEVASALAPSHASRSSTPRRSGANDLDHQF
ncbi:uncharacterized protein L969DRAFT_90742 [Mixia osmundae IAM 14324]|uniref:Uncharacterized protein n=1 Tax=Mixia osmundae (strain CBS 9802 / IAM 14324 / JCM 22182 / KY 12970) TaxID=764103 RepID=G7E1W1_MIXOS|nr:uncharacterized protein L969DRAFT_90742 [Mixia osmundae IAM 14324]KEI36768.1 hypothetical protein L969DRAFT_90742 [Mixia osmundae IAM 14324]GAA96821.1 hypothetical protein E5Q_03493 [Mixia osmundae IAM 14324]